MAQPDETLAAMRLRTYEAGVRRRLTPARLAQCQQLARTFECRTLAHGLSANWKARLLQDVSSAIRELLLQMVDKAEGRAVRWPPP